MDKEISYAKYAGLDYWAFCWYPPHSGLDTARQLYLASLHKSDVKWCVILGTNPFDYDTDGPWLVKRFGASNYQKVADGRPLVYLFTSPDAKGYEIARLRRLTADAGLPDPYVVVMAFSAAHADSIATHEKADAISCYASSYNFKTGGQYDGAAYDAVAGSDRAGWEKYKATGRAVVPWVTTGWSPRPRIDRSVSWGAYYKSNGWAQDATPAGIAENLQNARDWVGSNKVAAKAGVVLMYAWNEFDEGGWICPTLGDSTHRLDAIRQVLKR
ncbi:hypothetical protein GCM10023143_14300 [Compostibacter hankyongensis]|uniref:Uncharacterized protein n=2 Tax=Compostibacter hankyongensis TaxID=1007089 RepID=A0ABP8FN47_9BACT